MDVSFPMLVNGEKTFWAQLIHEVVVPLFGHYGNLFDVRRTSWGLNIHQWAI